MLFLNATDKTLHFELDGVAYDVPTGATATIPDRIAYCVKLHGLPLTPVDAASLKTATSKPAPALTQPTTIDVPETVSEDDTSTPAAEESAPARGAKAPRR